MAFSRLTVAILSGGLAVCSPIAAAAQTPSAQLGPNLSQLDAASQRFHSARANFEWDYYERVVRDTTKQSGQIYFERKGNDTDMGAVVTDPATKAQLKVLKYSGGTLQVFDPGANHIDELHAGANQAEYEGFLTLGFGGSGHDLARAWDITDQGSENMDDGGHPVKVEKLDLKGKDQNVQNMFTHVTIWVDLARGVSLKQVFYTPSGDIRTAIYSHIQLNGKIDTKAYAIKSNGSTTRSVH
jgi:hypothetical protein